jgi:hypothetical protein
LYIRPLKLGELTSDSVELGGPLTAIPLGAWALTRDFLVDGKFCTHINYHTRPDETKIEAKKSKVTLQKTRRIFPLPRKLWYQEQVLSRFCQRLVTN